MFESEQNPNGILLEVIFLGIDTVILLVLLFVLNSKSIRKICNYVSKLCCCGTYGTVDDVSHILSEVKMEQIVQGKWRIEMCCNYFEKCAELSYLKIILL